MTGLELWTPGALIWGGAVLLTVGGGALLVLQTRPALRPSIRAVWPEYAVLSLVFAAVCVSVLLHEWLLPWVLCAMGARLGWELLRTLAPRQAWAAPCGAFLGALVPLLPVPMVIWGSVWIAVLVVRFALRGHGAVQWIDPILHPVLPFVIFATGFADPSLLPVFMAALLLGETFDGYALIGGRLFGKRPLAPRLSPGKTIEGTLAGAVMLCATAALAAVLADDLGPQAMAAALLVGCAALAGDLWASHLKRRAGVKDFPSLLPPQGGLLDVTDSWIASGAALALALSVL